MKKLLLLTLTVLLAAPCFALKTYFTGVPLESVPSPQGSNSYQHELSRGKKAPTQGKYTLTVQEEENAGNTEELFDTFFWADLYERDEEGTYRQTRELNYKNDTPGKMDASTSRTYYLADENGELETAIFEVKRAKEIDQKVRFYTFTFEVKLQGDDISIRDYRYGGVLTFSPQGYFEYMVHNFAERWIHETNSLILEVFNQ